jgi:magnesium transporter
VDAGLQELVAFFERHRFYGVPVVDQDGLLVGVLRRRAVESAVAERSEADFRASQGIVGGEELRSMPLLVRSGRRLSWLSVNIALNVLAASIIAYHQETLQAVIALAVFLPIISDMSGCSGAQAVAVSMRELTLGVTRPADIVRVLRQELWVGLVNGLALGVLIALVAWAWKGNPWLGVVVGGALALNTVVAVCVGGGVPLALKRLGRDPALASGPILTTVTDMCGFLLVLTFASAMLGRLS